MKKLRLLLVSLLTLLLAGCKTLPAGRSVDPIELLDNKSGFYIAIPKAADVDLVNRVIQNNINNISEKDAQSISGYINKIYCSLNRSKAGTQIQASVDSKVPVKLVPKVLTPKNGWKTIKYSTENSANQYQYFSNQSIDISFLGSNISCFGRNINEMIDKYDVLSALPEDDTELYSDLDADLLSYLKAAENEIRFYANKPESFLTILTGAQLDLKLVDVKGTFTTDVKHDNQYILNLSFNFKNEKYLKAGRTLLTLTFGLTNSQSSIVNNNELIISGIRIDKQQLYKLLVL